MKHSTHCLSLAAFWLLLCTSTLAQRTVSGTVKGDDGDVLAGVSVQVKDTKVLLEIDTLRAETTRWNLIMEKYFPDPFKD